MNLNAVFERHLKFTIMKKVIFFIASLLFASIHTNATTKAHATAAYGGYSNSFIFVENGIEFSVFRDGQFDFNLLNHNTNLNVGIHTRNVSISFNSGYDYNAYVQYDEYGAIIQIENIPIFYDYYGRITRAGNVAIQYNNFGYINRVGGLYVHYNRYNRFSHYTGYINSYNRAYTYRPWHRYYSVPARDYCVVYNRPYRRYYAPVRYRYSRPYYNNRRPVTAIANRRGTVVARNRSYATVNRSSRNRTTIANKTYGRRVVSPQNNRVYNNRKVANATARTTTAKRSNNNYTTRRSSNLNTNRSQRNIATTANTKRQVTKRTLQTPRGTITNKTIRKSTVTRTPKTSTTRNYNRSRATKSPNQTKSRYTQNKSYSRSRSIASTQGRRR
jgi:hypothetical protein